MELHYRLGPKLKAKAAKIGAGFVDTCLGHLRASVTKMADLRAALANPEPGVSGSDQDGGDATAVGGVAAVELSSAGR